MSQPRIAYSPVVDAGGGAELASTFRAGDVENLAGLVEEGGHELRANRAPAWIGDGEGARVDAVCFPEDFNERFFETKNRGVKPSGGRVRRVGKLDHPREKSIKTISGECAATALMRSAGEAS